MKPTNLVLFGDQTVEKRSSIQALVRHSKTSAGARRLLHEATDLVQLHFGRLSKEERAWNHDIHTLLGLAEDNIAESKPNGIIATILMCIGRLGELIVYAEEDPSILGSENDPTEVLAFCTGLLPAAALVAARDTSEIIELAREIISITLRMSTEIFRKLILVDDPYHRWATTLVGMTPEKVQPILDEYHESQNVPYPKRIAIGIVSNGWVTLIGAPSSLDRLFEHSKVLDDASKMKTDTNGPVHTPYLPQLDFDHVLGDSPLLDTPITSKARLTSPVTCKPYEHTTLRSLLAEIVPDIVHRILRIDDTATASIEGISTSRPLALTVAGPTGHLTAVEKILKSKKIRYEVKQHRAYDMGVSRRGGSDLIAVTGMSARLPGSETVDAFFESLVEGKIQMKKIPKSRFDLDTYYDPTGKRRHTTSTDQGAFMERPGHFDNRLFNVSPREALQMDPLQRLLLTTSYEALEMAGYSKDATPATQSNRIATYFGQASEDWREVLNNDEDIDIYYVPGLSRPFGPSRLAYHHKWGGGTYALDAACATSTTAIHLACQALMTRECDTALAGGGSLCVSPTGFAGLSKSGMTSDNGGCRTYHDDADGYVRGEGIGVIVLKRLEDAIADNDNILGVIHGHARTYTSTSTSITHPSAESQARTYEEVLRQTSVAPNEVAYVEMHGTGTQAGDFEEMTSVLRVLGQERSKKNILTVGAVKANIGHGEAVAGVTSLIKVLMMIREKKIPPQPGLPFKLNRHFPKLDKVHLRIAGVNGSKDLTLKPSPTSRNGTIKCLVSSFDASGGNTSLVVEEPPAPLKKANNPLPAHVVTLSARTPVSLQNNRKRLLDYLVRNPQTKLADLGYTTTARRMHEVLRVAYTGKSTKDIMASLRNDVSNNGSSDPKKKAPAMKIVFTFTGQGSQYAGMGQQLYQHSAAFRELLQNYQQMIEYMGLPKFLHLITDENADIANASPVLVQLAVVALEIATAQLFGTWGITPDLVMGHSLGEYAALAISGVLSVSEALFLVGKRAQIMEQQLTAGEYAMLAVSKDVEAMQQVLTANSQALAKSGIACVNAPQITVVSGPISEIETLKDTLEQEGSRATVLNTPYGFHSHHIDPVLGEFERVAQSVTFSAPKTPIASTLLGKVVEAGTGDVFSPKYLIRQARERVNFVGALESFQNHALSKAKTTWMEMGPEPVGVGLVKRTLMETPANRLLPTMKAAEDNWVTVCAALASLHQTGANINWTQYHKEFQGSLAMLPLPTYAFDEKEYWMPYVERVDPALAPVASGKEIKALSAPSPPAFSTTSLQWIEEEVVDGKSVSVTFASLTSDPNLYAAIKGHVVTGMTICSLSVFCDMAKSAAQYAYQKARPGSKLPQMSVYDVDMTHALVVPKLDPTQIVKTKVTYSASEPGALVNFSSIKGGVTTEHGDFKVVYEDTSAWFAQQSQMSFLIDARIQALKEMSASGKAHRLLKSVAYKLFDSLVAYGPNYQGMEEVWVDGQCQDAVGTIKLPNTAGAGNFLYNPFWTDAAIHLAGFLANGGLKYPEDIACLSTGFDSWRSIEELRPDEVYTTYVSMQETEGPNILAGSAYVFNSKQKLVSVTHGIRFQKMKKIVLSALLGAKPSAMPASAPAPTLPSSSEKTVAWPKDLVSSNTKMRPSTGTSTPLTQVTDFGFNESAEPSGVQTPATSVDEEPAEDLFKTLVSIVVAESGCSESELEPGVSFADLGMDSLMAITCLATFQRDTGVELPPTFFLDNQTVAEVQDALPGGSPNRASANAAPAASIKADDAVETAPAPTVTFVEPEPPKVQSQPEPEPEKQTPPQAEPPQAAATEDTKASKAILLHGSESSAGPKLFLLPDGSGSPSRYIQLPTLGADINVYGLESPFVKTPSEFTYSVETMCASFLDAIKKVQSSGPYLLGGFSLGALYAYEISKLLGQSGESIDGLFVVDMAVPQPINVGPLTQDQLKEAGLLPTVGRLTPAQKEHFVSTVQAMTSYRATPTPSSQRPKKTVLVSSKNGLGVGKKSELAAWAKGSSSASRGWEELLGSVEGREIDADHFAMFRHPTVKVLGDIWSDALGKI